MHDLPELVEPSGGLLVEEERLELFEKSRQGKGKILVGLRK